MSVRSLNNVQLIGNLTRDPELRYTAQGTAVCTFGLATNREWTDKNGQKQEEAEFHRIVAWQKLAELCSQLLFKGRKVYVDGRLQTRKWTGADNVERQTTEVVIDNMILLDSRYKEGAEASPKASQGSVSAGAASSPGDDSIPASADDSQAQADDSDKDEKKEKKAQPKVAAKAKAGADKKPGKKAAKTSEEVKADDIPF